MSAFAAAGSAFLIAVLWFDLMFDVQLRGCAGPVAPAAVLTSIGGYYRRVTTDARPMNRLIALVMLLTIAALIAELVRAEGPLWRAGISLLLALVGIGLALGRTVRNAVALGRDDGEPAHLTRLARDIYLDHRISLAAMATVLGLQLLIR